ncbi:phosphoribosyl transferase domain protein [Candidatus Velamenicoccus archaeovorus]|uniref:Phosphoribosyl transferase domain protein n=1 Tax=Velamenicoccus archaeovorus TaxID=1930593 RepID=A0A410P364_VELA1|nr:phosphoribosyltransferase family protein [Candidatus Velamenicoccus archaeovorus]QAT16637.1 phosphoribosyl transferase domain protein [Candidatus Velamenicoccus archaeovorus]
MGRIRVISYEDRIFQDRREAGRFLSEALKKFQGRDALVLGIPRGGLVVAAEIARAIGADMDAALTRKIGAPLQPELAIGALSESGQIYLNSALAAQVGADEEYIEQEKARQAGVIKERAQQYRKVRPKASVTDRLVIVTDDGAATGATMLATLWSLRQEKPQRLIAALPVVSGDAVEILAGAADELVVLQVPMYLAGISQFYGDFSQTSDDEVVGILKEFAARRGRKL